MKECKFCHKEFSAKRALKLHQKTAKYCLKIQGVESGTSFSCNYCEKQYIRKSHCQQHQKICSQKDVTEKEEINGQLQGELNKKDAENQSLKKELENLKMMMKDHADATKAKIKEKDEKIANLEGKYEVSEDHYTKETSKTKTTININPKIANLPITTIEPLTKAYIKRKIDEEFKFELFEKDPIGSVINLITDMISIETEDGVKELNYACTDVSRHKCYRLLGTREWTQDVGAEHINSILDEMDEKSDDYCGRIRETLRAIKVQTVRDADEVFNRADRLQTIQRGLTNSRGVDRKKLFGNIRGQICNNVAV